MACETNEVIQRQSQWQPEDVLERAHVQNSAPERDGDRNLGNLGIDDWNEDGESFHFRSIDGVDRVTADDSEPTKGAASRAATDSNGRHEVLGLGGVRVLPFRIPNLFRYDLASHVVPLAIANQCERSGSVGRRVAPFVGRRLSGHLFRGAAQLLQNGPNR